LIIQAKQLEKLIVRLFMRNPVYYIARVPKRMKFTKEIGKT